jgi:chaperonin GroES
MALNIRPLGDRVIVEPVEEEEQTFAGGQLVLPDTAKEKPQQGRVLAVGPGKRDEDGDRIPIDLQVDDIVIYAKYSGTNFRAPDGTEILILRESDVLAVLE